VKFCSQCGDTVALRIPEGDDRERYVCASCHTIHYTNPRLIVGCLPVWEDKVLLCRRAIEPRLGFWTLPAGFMENGETTEQGAARETWEEARARVSDLSLYRVYDVPYINQVYLFYLCALSNGEHAAGPESTETALFERATVPWDELAFPSIYRALHAYFDDREAGVGFSTVVETIYRRRHAGG
jgi:ADP-ribose pyrophosphatase YjhB (NUDIX family)